MALKAELASGRRRAGRIALPEWLPALGVGGVVLMAMSIPALAVFETWAGRRAEVAAWDIKGPPCPVVDRPARSVVGVKPPKASAYGDMRFSRYFGHVSCVGFREGGLFRQQIRRVCQFSRPGAVSVTAGGRTVVYQTGDASPATVTVRGGEISCVMAGWFRY